MHIVGSEKVCEILQQPLWMYPCLLKNAPECNIYVANVANAVYEESNNNLHISYQILWTPQNCSQAFGSSLEQTVPFTLDTMSKLCCMTNEMSM